MSVKMRSSVSSWRPVAKPRLSQNFSLLGIAIGLRVGEGCRRRDWRQCSAMLLGRLPILLPFQGRSVAELLPGTHLQSMAMSATSLIITPFQGSGGRLRLKSLHPTSINSLSKAESDQVVVAARWRYSGYVEDFFKYTVCIYLIVAKDTSSRLTCNASRLSN